LITIAEYSEQIYFGLAEHYVLFRHYRPLTPSDVQSTLENAEASFLEA
jgi:hypothetical protein